MNLDQLGELGHTAPFLAAPSGLSVEDLNLVGAKICSAGDLYTARQPMSHLSITGLVPRPSVQVMIRAF